MPPHRNHLQITRVHVAVAALISILIVSLFVLVVPAHGASQAADPADLQGFSTAAKIATFVFIAALLTFVATVGKLLFRHADRHGEGLRDEVPVDAETTLSHQTTRSIADGQGLATRIG